MNDEPDTGPGKRLKAAREAMEVSAREVADALNLPLRVISALESDDYERLPPSVFTRGYLRSYARLLELSPDELLALYPEVQTDAEPAPETPPPSALGTNQNRLLIGAALAVLAIAVVVWLLTGDEEPARTDPIAPVEVEPVSTEQDTADEVPDEEPEAGAATGLAGTAAEPVDARTAVGADADRVPAGRDAAAADAVEPAPAAAEPLALENEPPALEEPAPTAPGVRRITEFGDETLSFYFERDCWVEVKSRDGENLYSDLNRAGRRLELVGRGPFRIRLGYAPGVTLEFNGEPVDLARYTRNNVANLVLGE